MTGQLPRERPGEAVLSAAHSFAAAHGRKLTVGDVEWRYIRLGEGPPGLWLTGGLRRAGLWYNFLRRLVLSSSGPADYGRPGCPCFP